MRAEITFSGERMRFARRSERVPALEAVKAPEKNDGLTAPAAERFFAPNVKVRRRQAVNAIRDGKGARIAVRSVCPRRLKCFSPRIWALPEK